MEDGASKTILVPICNRTNYSKIRPVLFALKKHKINIKIIASSSFVLTQYGNAYQEVLSDGFKIEQQIDCLLANDSSEAMTKTSALSMIEHSSIIKKINPDGFFD